MACRVVRTTIGEELKARGEIPQDLPIGMLALLIELTVLRG
jgi:hypothetical protein